MNENQIKKIIVLWILSLIFGVMYLFAPFSHDEWKFDSGESGVFEIFNDSFLSYALSFENIENYIGSSKNAFLIISLSVIMVYLSCFLIAVPMIKRFYYKSQFKLISAIEYLSLSVTSLIIGIIIYNKGTIVGYKRKTYYLEHSYTHIILGTILVIIDIIYLLLSIKEYKFKKKNQEYNHKIQKKHLFSGRKIEHIVISSVFIVMLLYLFQYFIKNFDGINYTDVVKVFIN